MNTSSPTSPKKPDPLKILIQGAPGSFKTTLALQFPEPHVFYCDSSLDGPEKFLRDPTTQKLWGIDPGLNYTYDSVRFNDKGEALPIYECFDRLVSLLRKALTDPAYLARKTIIIDNLSHVNRFLVAKVLKKQGKDSEESTMEGRDWSPFAQAAYSFICPHLERLNKNIIVLCHETKIVEPDKQNMFNKIIIGYEPAFSGQVGDSLGSFFGDVWRTQVSKGVAGSFGWTLQVFRSGLCDILKNSLGLTKELDLNPTDLKQPRGFKVLEPYLKGKI